MHGCEQEIRADNSLHAQPSGCACAKKLTGARPPPDICAPINKLVNILSAGVGLGMPHQLVEHRVALIVLQSRQERGIGISCPARPLCARHHLPGAIPRLCCSVSGSQQQVRHGKKAEQAQTGHSGCDVPAGSPPRPACAPATAGGTAAGRGPWRSWPRSRCRRGKCGPGHPATAHRCWGAAAAPPAACHGAAAPRRSCRWRAPASQAGGGAGAGRK